MYGLVQLLHEYFVTFICYIYICFSFSVFSALSCALLFPFYFTAPGLLKVAGSLRLSRQPRGSTADNCLHKKHMRVLGSVVYTKGSKNQPGRQGQAKRGGDQWLCAQAFMHVICAGIIRLN